MSVDNRRSTGMSKSPAKESTLANKQIRRVCDCKFANFCRMPEDDDVIQEKLQKQFGLVGDDLLRWKFQHRNEEIQLPREETMYDQIKCINLLLNEIEYISEIPTSDYLEYHSTNLKNTINNILQEMLEKEAKRKRQAADMKVFVVY
uniref:Uncharacterized protein n=1 Tax=Lygus hesperus TaxID=30085 RepID=A0A0K8SQP9_LYGHE